MVKVLRSKISILPIFQCYLENLASLNACFPLFHTPFFYFKLYKISIDPTPVETFMAFELIKFNGFQIRGNESDDTPYLMP